MFQMVKWRQRSAAATDQVGVKVGEAALVAADVSSSEVEAAHSAAATDQVGIKVEEAALVAADVSSGEVEAAQCSSH